MSGKNDAKDSIFARNRTINIRGELREIRQPWVMGILNVTPDSFFDGGKYEQVETALKRTRQMLDEGADIIDIGASSTRPGAEISTPKIERERLAAVFPAVRKAFPETIISLDTYHSEVARWAADNGADMINDISGGTLDTEMPKTMGSLKLPYILMHSKGTPATMQNDPVYDNVFKEVAGFFSQQMAMFMEHGINDIILDPGFGFAKTLEHNYELLEKLDQFKIFNKPLLVGVSRKSMINKIIGRKADDALNGTTVVHTIALNKGADILRVHDVREAVEAVKILTFTQKFT